MLAEQPSEYDVYLASERINERGIKVDLALAEAAIKRVEEEKSDLSATISKLTDGRITSPTQGKRLRSELGPEIKRHPEAIDIITRIVTDRRAGGTKTTYSLDRQARSQLLDLGTSNPGYFSPYMMELLELMQAASNSSVKKFQTMKDRAGKDGRVRDSYICNGASQTGRFSARGLQLHNFSRTVPKDPEKIRNALINGGQIDNVYATMAAMLRYALVAADGCSFVCADYSQIESRVLLYLCQAPAAALDIFRKMDADSESTIDNYIMAASSIFGKPPEEITKEQRNIGKVSVLACGFGGGARAFAAMARAFGITIPEDQARDIVARWRSANPEVVGFWRDLEKAALDAILNEGTVYEAGAVSLYAPPKASVLYLQLPSGRMLSYQKPFAKEVDGPHGVQWEITALKPTWRPAQGQKWWPRVKLYGGLIAENATQGMAADFLRRSIVELDQLGWPVIAHTHDEIMLEIPDEEVPEASEALKQVMLYVPKWAEGLPLNCELWTGKRYRK